MVHMNMDVTMIGWFFIALFGRPGDVSLMMNATKVAIKTFGLLFFLLFLQKTL